MSSLERKGLELQEKGTFEGHKDYVYGGAVFDSEMYGNRFFSCSRDVSVRVWDMGGLERRDKNIATDQFPLKLSGPVERSTKHERCRSINDILKWDEDTVIVLSNTFLRSYSVHTLEMQNSFLEDYENELLRLCKISKKKFICTTRESSIIVFDYSVEYPLISYEDVTMSDVGCSNYYSVPVPSKKYPNCIYINTKHIRVQNLDKQHAEPEDVEVIARRIDVDTLKVDLDVIEPSYLDGSSNSYTITSYVNREEEEILIVGGMKSALFFFNVSSPKMKDNFRDRHFMFAAKISTSAITHLSCFFNRYLFAGFGGGTIKVYDLYVGNVNNPTSEEFVSGNHVSEARVSSDWVNKIVRVPYLDKVGETNFASLSEDSFIKFFQIKGMILESEKDKQSTLDLRERIEFLREDLVRLFCSQISEACLGIRIQGIGEEMIVIKSIVLLG